MITSSRALLGHKGGLTRNLRHPIIEVWYEVSLLYDVNDVRVFIL